MGDRVDRKSLDDLAEWKAKGNLGLTNGQTQKIAPNQRADLFCVNASTLTADSRAGNSISVAFNGGQSLSLDGRVFADFAAPSSDWAYALVPLDAFPTFPSGAGGSSASLLAALTLQATQTLANAALPNPAYPLLYAGDAASYGGTGPALYIYADNNGGIRFTWPMLDPTFNADYIELTYKGFFLINFTSGGNHTFRINASTGGIDTLSGVELVNYESGLASAATSGWGVEGIVGLDNRTLLTGTDASAITLYTTPATPPFTPQAFELSISIKGVAGTISSAIYTVVWTENGVTFTKTASITSEGTIANASYVIQPDPNTAITAQVTTLSGTGTPKVNVCAVLKECA